MYIVVTGALLLLQVCYLWVKLCKLYKCKNKPHTYLWSIW